MLKPVAVALWFGLLACGGPSVATIVKTTPTPSPSATAGRTPTSAVAIEKSLAETPPNPTATSATGPAPALEPSATKEITTTPATLGPATTLIPPPTPAPPHAGAATPTMRPTNTPAITPLRPMGIERVFPNLTFNRLTNLVQPDDGLNFLFVTEQRGMVRAFVANSGVSKSVVFLDITDKVNMVGNEEGLLGLAFDPNYRENGFFYVYYSADGPRRSVLSRFSVTADNPIAADPDSELTILEIPQPYSELLLLEAKA